MGRQVTREAVKDLIHSTHKMADWNTILFRSIRSSMLLLEQGRKEELIDMVAKDLSRRFDCVRENKEYAVSFSVESVLQELENHLDKRAVLDAAIAECEKIESNIEQLKELQLTVKGIFEKLDDRTKALFEIHDELMRLDGRTCLDYCDCIGVFFPPDVNSIRGDSTLAPAIEAYDLARDVNEML